MEISLSVVERSYNIDKNIDSRTREKSLFGTSMAHKHENRWEPSTHLKAEWNVLMQVSSSSLGCNPQSSLALGSLWVHGLSGNTREKYTVSVSSLHMHTYSEKTETSKTGLHTFIAVLQETLLRSSAAWPFLEKAESFLPVIGLSELGNGCRKYQYSYRYIRKLQGNMVFAIPY